MSRDGIRDVLDRLAFFSILGFAFSMAMSFAVLNICLYGTVFFFIARKLLTQEFRLPEKQLQRLFLGFFIIVILSLFNIPSEHIGMGLKGVKKILCYMIFTFAVMEALQSKERLKKVLICLGMGVFVTSLNGLFQYVVGYDVLRSSVLHHEYGATGLDILRATSTYTHPNHLGTYISTLIFPMVLFAYFYVEGRRGLGLKIAVALSALALIFSFSRGAALAVVATGILLLLIKRNRTLWATLIAAIIVVPFLLPKDLYRWISHSKSTTQFLFDSGSFHGKERPSSRLDLWTTGMNMLKAHPWVGAGFYTFSDQYRKYREPTDKNDNIRAHNSFVQVLAECGWLGFMVFVGILCFVFRRGIKAYRSVSDPFLQLVILGFLLSLTAFLTNGLYESTLRIARFAPIFWFLIGGIIATCRLIPYRF